MSDRRVLVVGGGITGLAAAARLVDERSVDVELWEASDRLGGKIATSPFGGLPHVDEGADAYLRRVPHAVAFARKVGLGPGELTSPTDARAMVWYDGQPAPVRIKTKGQWVERLASDDRLGQGQGTVHQQDGWEWSIRAYPTRPYFAVQLQYTNQTEKPVHIKALLPFCVGEPGKGMIVLGPNTDQSRVFLGLTSGAPQIATAEWLRILRARRAGLFAAVGDHAYNGRFLIGSVHHERISRIVEET